MTSAFDYTYVFKYIVIGDVGSGKSCLMHRFVERKFAEHMNHTIGVEFGSRVVSVSGHRIKLQIWDTAGQERFRSVTRSYYRGAAGAILVYDITRRSTFEHVTSWLADAHDHAAPHLVVFLVGNKSDMAHEREVPKEEAEEFARKNGILFTEVSAKTADRVDQCFMETTSRIYQLVASGTIPVDDVDSGVNQRTVAALAREDARRGCSC